VLNGLDLFSGIGGISIALDRWVRTVAYCEADRYAQAVLLSRMSEGELHRAPIWDDVRALTASMLPEIDIIFGGFPCQDISVAGNGKGLEGERSGLFFEIARLAKEIQPAFIFLENVPAIRTRGLKQVVETLSSIGYDCRWTTVSAREVGAAHLRRRWFLLAYSLCVKVRIPESGQWDEEIYVASTLENGETYNSNGKGLERPRNGFGDEKKKPFSTDLLEGHTWDEYASFFLRVGDGLPNRTHSLKCLGNAVVPPQAEEAFERLIGLNPYP
jgi:DNA (cytosine-5)-methyltransferase 1